MVKPTLLVLAAGMGSRYGGLKVAEPVGPGGESVVDYSIFDAHRAGFGRVALVVRRDTEDEFKRMAGARFGRHVPVEYVRQELTRIPAGFRVPPGRKAPWGTTQAVLVASSLIREPFAVINVDDFYGAESFKSLAHHLQSGTADCAMVGYVLRNTLSEFGAVARGVCQVDDNGYLQEIRELKSVEREVGHARSTDPEGRETRLSGDEIVSMNMWGFTPVAFDSLSRRFEAFLRQNGADLKAECVLPNSVSELVGAGQARVKVLRTGDAWFGITYREDHTSAVEKIRRLIQDGHYPRQLWK
ncbi:MAG TPA: NTP transferase domain-containing protein [Terracidiphilus sp.]|nr:NTP transferase domain-containing protein [Terracidiphilus sp.]